MLSESQGGSVRTENPLKGSTSGRYLDSFLDAFFLEEEGETRGTIFQDSTRRTWSSSESPAADTGV